METISVNINVPSDIFAALNENEEGFKKEFTMSAAAWLYQNEKLSLAKAASLAGISRYDFESFLADNKIPISLENATTILNDAGKI